MLFLWMLLLEGGRYLVVAGAAFLVFWIWLRERYRTRWVPRGPSRSVKIAHDLRWSLSTSLVFATFAVMTQQAAKMGIVRRYATIGERGWLWFGFTVIALIVLQDTYFYWTHRAMHHPKLYRWFHKVHHASVQTSPWTAYAFSPLEAATHAAFVPLVWLFLPMHELAVFSFMLFMVTRNVLGHLSIELFPSGFTRGRVTGLSTTTTHHALHHRHFRANFGLYFTFWDRAMGTLHPAYEEEFESVQSRT
ncbi:MAG: sterol desaturase family protein [Polyangiales bacterium]